jgi:hypothetical protein
VKKNLRFAIVVLAFAAAITGCSSPSGEPSGPTGPKTYNIGDTGPAGGLIFYDQGSVINGWRYMEAGLTDLSAPWAPSGPAPATGVTATAIGTGQANTNSLFAFYGNSSSTIYAARSCKLYTFGGYSDWFLPSKDECTTMLTALALHGLGALAPSTNTGPQAS